MRKKLLIIENDPAIQGIVSFILETEGYDIATSNHTIAAEMNECDADLILLDEWINKKEGQMLCTELKKIHKLQHIPVIILSTSPDVEEIAKKCKADGFVCKPFDLDDLIAEVKRCLPITKDQLA